MDEADSKTSSKATESDPTASADVIFSEDILARIKEQEKAEEQAIEGKFQHPKRKRPFLILLLLSLFLGTQIEGSAVHFWIQKNLSYRLEIPFRDWLTSPIPLSKKLKIVAFDDRSFSKMQRANITLLEWANLLKKIADQKPQAIMIDKVFGLLSDYRNEASKAIKILNEIPVPIYTGSFTRLGKIKGRLQVPELANYAGSNKYFIENIGLDALHAITDRTKHLSYGAHKAFAKAFIPGHIVKPKTQEVDFALKLSGENILPHMGLRVAKHFRMGPGGKKLWIDQTEVGLRDGKVAINFVNPMEVYKRGKGIHLLLKYSPKRTAKFIKKDDVVVFLPTFYTGSGDYIDTPYGEINGGFIPVSLANSVLTKKWIFFFPFDSALIYLFVALGCSLMLMKTTYLIIASVLTPIAIIMGSLLIFTYYSTVCEWQIWLISFMIPGVFGLIMRNKMDQAILKNNNGLVQNAKIQARERLLLKAREKVLLQEKKDASLIASSLLPKKAPTDWQGVKVDAFHECFDAASGDWFYYVSSDDQSFFHIAMLDIAGHGVQAAIVVASCKTLITNYTQKDKKWLNSKDFHVQVAHRLNEILTYQGEGNHISTYCGLTIEPKENKVHVVCCAAPAPLLLKGGTKQKTLKISNSHIGTKAESKYDLLTEDFEVGDKILLFTDGVPLGSHRGLFKKNLMKNGKLLDENFAEWINLFQKSLKEVKNIPIEDDQSVVLVSRI